VIRKVLWCRAALLGLVLAAGCNDGGSAPVFDVLVETASGQDPLESRQLESLRIRAKEGSGEVQTLERSVEGGDFDVRLPVSRFDTPLEVRLELLGADGPLIGAPPRFIAGEVGEFLRIVVGEPGQCAVVPEGELPRGVQHAGVAKVGTFALVLGGTEAEGPSSMAGFVDLLRMISEPFNQSLSAPRGPSRLAPLSASELLLVSARQDPIVFDLSGSEAMRTRPFTLHAGAGPSSAVVPRTGGGAVVLGGRDGEQRVRTVTWVGPEGEVQRTELATPRADATAVELAAGVLVAGGMAGGEPLVELVDPGQAQGEVVLEAPDHGRRDGALMFADRDGTRALLIGGVDGEGQIRADTRVLSDCVDGCDVREGPEWQRPRTEAAVARLPGGGLLVGGQGPQGAASPARDRIRFDAEGVQIAPAEPLSGVRSGAGVVALGSGVTLVVGGRGDGGIRRDVEICWPPELLAP
jgi:hypothetical protein